jgi:hypothetical protein
MMAKSDRALSESEVIRLYAVTLSRAGRMPGLQSNRPGDAEQANLAARSLTLP